MDSPMSVLIAGTKDRYDGNTAIKSRYVHAVSNEDLKNFFDGDKEKRQKFRKKYKDVDAAKSQRLFFIMRLGIAISKRDDGRIIAAVESYLDSFIEIETAEDSDYYSSHILGWLQDIKSRPAYVLSREINEWLDKVKLISWWAKADKRLYSGLYCEDIVTALFVLWITHLPFTKGVSVCAQCGSIFERSRRNQIFCTANCQNVAGVRRYRRKRR